LIFALTRAHAIGVAAAGTLAPLAGSLALLAGFAALERRAKAALVPRRLLRRRRALAACLAIVANAGAIVGVVVLSTLYLRRILGFSALEAGLAFVPLAGCGREDAGAPARPGRQRRPGTAARSSRPRRT
jgi:hypothetical protein